MLLGASCFFEDVPLVVFIYLVFTRTSYCRRFRSLLLCPLSVERYNFPLFVIIVVIILVVMVLNALLFQPLSFEISFMEAITPLRLKYPRQIVSHMLCARACVL